MGAATTPAHLLFFDEPFAQNLIHGRFDKGRRDPLARPPQFIIVRKVLVQFFEGRQTEPIWSDRSHSAWLPSRSRRRSLAPNSVQKSMPFNLQSDRPELSLLIFCGLTLLSLPNPNKDRSSVPHIPTDLAGRIKRRRLR